MKMKMKNVWRVCIGLLCITSVSTVNATLVSRLDGQALYNAELNVTWIADVKLASRNTFGVEGISSFGAMSWRRANEWIAAMNAENYLGFNDWRLPTADVGCSNSRLCANPAPLSGTNNGRAEELGQLFYNELGGVFGQAINRSENPNLALFDQGDRGRNGGGINTFAGGYFTGTETNPREVHSFDFFSGFENSRADKNTLHSVIALRDGDVGISAVPVPAAVWLFGSGLIGLVGIARRKTNA